jgi:hypothetical protein
MPLCVYCQTLNLGSPTRPTGRYQIGTRQWIYQSAENGCRFCQLIWAADTFWTDDWEKPEWIEWTRDGFTLPKSGPLIVPMGYHGYIPPTPRGYGRYVYGKGRSKMLRRWLKICQHGDANSSPHMSCKPLQFWRPSGGVRATARRDHMKIFRLVNVNFLCVRSFRPNQSIPQYAALSYVQGGGPWPQFSRQDLDTWLKRRWALRNQTMGKTHWDTIRVVQNLGLDWVWIDKICLAYKDNWDNGMQNMDRVYGAAVLTIIAADGENTNGGITSMTTRRGMAPDQNAVDVAQGWYWCITKSVHAHMHFNKYVTRGWT